MKKIATLLLAAGLVFGAATGASAIDFKAKGQWIMSFDYGQNGGFTGGNGMTGFNKANKSYKARTNSKPSSVCACSWTPWLPSPCPAPCSLKSAPRPGARTTPAAPWALTTPMW